MSAALDRLLTFLRFPSVSTDPALAGELSACAEWLVGELRASGLEAAVHPTARHPVVLGRTPHQPGRPTVLLYGHYDVQPVDEPARAEGGAPDPNKHWLSDPFDPQVRDGIITARGASDNKGQIMAHLAGVRATLEAGRELPVNLIVLVEGEEEIGSPNLEGFLAEHREELRCDVVAISDTGMVAPGVPTLTYGLRGIAAMELRVTGPASDLHSGIYGGVVANPATAVARLVAALHDGAGRVAVPGFYDGIAPLQDWERAGWATLPFNDEMLLRVTGSPTLFGEAGYTPVERAWARPTAEVNGLGGGFQGEGSKTVIPREAFAKLTFRLVPGQEPARVVARVEEHLRAHCPAGVELTLRSGHAGEPYVNDPHSRWGRAAQRALRTAFGREDVALIREGGSIPIVNTFRRVLGADTLLLGLALPDCRAHGPNETFPVANFEAGMRLNRALLEELGGVV